jgi:hypothetical protein
MIASANSPPPGNVRQAPGRPAQMPARGSTAQNNLFWCGLPTLYRLAGPAGGATTAPGRVAWWARVAGRWDADMG